MNSSLLACERKDILTGALIVLAILSAMLCNGQNIYMLSLSWGAMVFVFVYLTTQVRTVSFKLNPAMILLLLFVTWMTVSLLWHPVVWQGAYFNASFGLFAASAICVYLFANVFSMRAFVTTFIVITIGVSILSAYQSIFLGTMANGLFANKNNNAALHLLAILPLMSILLFGDRGVMVKWLARIALAVLLFGYLSASSRGAHVGFLFGGGGLLYLAVRDRRYSNVVSLLTLFIVVISVYMMLPAGFSPKISMYSSGRWGIWGATVSMLFDTPWYGAGNGMYILQFPDYRPADLWAGIGNFAHNDYLQILFELGIPGLMLLVGFYTVLSMQVVSTLPERNSDRTYAWYLGTYAALSTVAIHSMFTFNLYIPSILLTMGFYTGYLLNMLDEDKENKHTGKRIEIPRGYVFVSIFLFVIVGKWLFLSGIANAIARGVLIEGEGIYGMAPQQAREKYRKLALIDPLNYQYPMLEARNLANTGTDYSYERRIDTYNQAMALLDQSISINPYANEPYFTKARIIRDYQDVVGDAWYQKVTTILSRRIARDPHHLSRGRMELAAIYESRGDIKQALRLVLEGLSYPSVFDDIEALEYGRIIAIKANSKYAEDAFDYYIKRYICINSVLPVNDSNGDTHENGRCN